MPLNPADSVYTVAPGTCFLFRFFLCRVHRSVHCFVGYNVTEYLVYVIGIVTIVVWA